MYLRCHPPFLRVAHHVPLPYSELPVRFEIEELTDHCSSATILHRDEEALQRLIWSVLMEALFTGLNAGMVHTFYCYRVWKLSKRNWILSGFLLILILATAASGTAWVIISMGLDTYRQLININPLTITINALSTACDVLIALSLCTLLHQSRTGFKKSDTIITRLMIFVVNTGVLTSMCAISSLVCLVVSPNTLIYAAFYFCIGRFYTNSFLATLNARKSLAGSVEPSERSTSHMAMSIPASVLHSNSTGRKNQDIAIRIETTKEAVMDLSDQSGQTGTKVSSHGLSRDDNHSSDDELAMKARPF
ncbi:hypothetical protein CC2G_002787 [Coprinopsis cinerea AmutBmut pab1-1]|nr:hypothetical protein CC2G_002787 [Coprinopsis cinerea AmutBmut pab1-1]